MRGTSNTNERGSSHSRRARREFLVKTYRADVDVWIRMEYSKDGEPFWVKTHYDPAPPGEEGIPACRCFRCGKLLTVYTVTVDRIKPGCKGGTYRRDNIRPACSTCNESTGGKLGAEQKKAKAVKRKRCACTGFDHSSRCHLPAAVPL